MLALASAAVRPPALFDQPLHGSYIFERWELRVTRRCLVEDLGRPADADFEDLLHIEIVKTFVKDRKSRTENTRQVAPLTSGRPVWVLARGNDHRAGTWYDEVEQVVWLLAYRKHRSGASDDFFPFCKELDREGRLFPDVDDYERLIRERDLRFVASVRLEAPLVLHQARQTGGEQRVMLGGVMGACVAIEVAEDLESTTVAFRVETIDFDLVPVVLACFHTGEWTDADRLPSRSLDPDEVAFEHLHERQ